MKSLGLKVIVFLLFFIVEVDIRAQMIRWPKDCDFQRPGCAIMSEGSAKWQTLRSANIEAHMSPGAALSRRAAHRIQLIGGQAIVANKASVPLEVSFPSGSVLLAVGHEVYLEVSTKEVQVHAHLSPVKVLDKDSSFELDPGLMVTRSLEQFPSWWSVPRPYAFEKMLTARMNAGLISGQDDAVSLARKWQQAARIASESSQHLVVRKIASEEKREREREKRRQQALQEAQKLRALFLKKNYLDQ